MADRHLHGWRHPRDERTGSWALFPRPASTLRPDSVDLRPLRPSTPFPQPSAGRPAPLRSAGRAPTAPDPRVIPLGGDLALVSVGQWDEESATTIQLPAVPPGPGPHPSSGSGDRSD